MDHWQHETQKSMEYRALPREVLDLCTRLNAPPRLVAHLTLVHDAAWLLTRELTHRFPTLVMDKDLILFGAATHDLGKAIHRRELVEQGHEHELEGRALLEDAGVAKPSARFAWTHANWADGVTIEDLVVALADKCWKGKRDQELEDTLTTVLSEQTGHSRWAVFAELDDAVTQVAENADARLAWQNSFPVE